MKTKITKRELERHIEAGNAVILWDTELVGFGVRISPKRKVAYFANKWQGGTNGSHKRITLGHFPLMTVQSARNNAIKELADASNGIDISARKKEKRKQLEQIAQADTVTSAVTLYLSRRSKPGSKYWKEVEQMLKRDLISVFPAKTPLASVTKGKLRDIIETKQDKSQSAARYLYAVLSPFFNFCVERELIPASPLSSIKSPSAVSPRQRILTEDEILLFWQACNSLGYPFGPIFKLLLLTGQRRNEAGGMRWSELDLAKQTWIIPANRTKNKKQHLVHLSTQAIEIIGTIPKLSDEFVFTQTLKSPVSGFSKAKAKLDQIIKLPSWRLHDLRRSAASIMRGLRTSKDVVEIVLNHTSGERGGLVSVYQRHELLEERKEAIIKLGQHISEITVNIEK